MLTGAWISRLRINTTRIRCSQTPGNCISHFNRRILRKWDPHEESNASNHHLSFGNHARSRDSTWVGRVSAYKNWNCYEFRNGNSELHDNSSGKYNFLRYVSSFGRRNLDGVRIRHKLRTANQFRGLYVYSSTTYTCYEGIASLGVTRGAISLALENTAGIFTSVTITTVYSTVNNGITVTTVAGSYPLTIFTTTSSNFTIATTECMQEP